MMEASWWLFVLVVVRSADSQGSWGTRGSWGRPDEGVPNEVSQPPPVRPREESKRFVPSTQKPVEVSVLGLQNVSAIGPQNEPIVTSSKKRIMFQNKTSKGLSALHIGIFVSGIIKSEDDHVTYRTSLGGPCGNSPVVEETLESLGQLVMKIVEQEMMECDLVLVYEHHYHSIFHHIVHLPVVLQVWEVRRPDDLQQVLWSSSRCRGYLLLLQHLDNFTNIHLDAWDYQGRYVVLAASESDLDHLMLSTKVRNTEHVLALVQLGSPGEWALFGGKVYGGVGVRRLTTWKGGNSSSHLHNLYPPPQTHLHGLLLQVATFKWEPNVFYQRGEAGRPDTPYGVDIDVVHSLARFYNFSVTYVQPAQGELWGEEGEGGLWSGLVGLLQRGQAQVGVASIYVSAARASVIDFTQYYDSRMSCFMARVEQPLPRWQALAYPFSAHAWSTIVAGFLLLGPVLCLLARASRYRSGGELPRLQQLEYSWMYTFGSHLQNFLPLMPRTTPTQLMVGFLGLYALILDLAYSTSLTAYLVASKPPASMDLIKELKESGVEIAGLGYFYKNALAAAIDPDLQSLTKTYHAHQTVETIFPRVLQGRSVFLQNQASIEFITLTRFTRRGISSMRIMKECFAPYGIALAVQRHSPLRWRFDRVIGWLQQSGLIRHFFLTSLRLAASTVEYSKTVEDGPAGEELHGEAEGGVLPLTTEHLQGIFFIIVLGWLLSLFVFFVENKLCVRTCVKEGGQKDQRVQEHDTKHHG
ncbi:glutamate receptor ionotropic, delta-2-like [Procambarus clarkii]|uniref:glutamate receptor ionotropic, delta-2-like n=1 Tax=Procambarus clarkii TaxID=6728 RepID=UPI003742F6EE